MDIFEFTRKLKEKGTQFHLVFSERNSAGLEILRPNGALRDDAGRCPSLSLADADPFDSAKTIGLRLGLSETAASMMSDAADGKLVGMGIGWSDDFRAQLLA